MARYRAPARYDDELVVETRLLVCARGGDPVWVQGAAG